MPEWAFKVNFHKKYYFLRPKAFVFYKSFTPFITHNRDKPLLYLSTISTSYASAVKKCTRFFICFSPASNVQYIWAEIILSKWQIYLFLLQLVRNAKLQFSKAWLLLCTQVSSLFPIWLIKTNEKSHLPWSCESSMIQVAAIFVWH